jgi:hypothetical protein
VGTGVGAGASVGTGLGATVGVGSGRSDGAGEPPAETAAKAARTTIRANATTKDAAVLVVVERAMVWVFLLLDRGTGLVAPGP